MRMSKWILLGSLIASACGHSGDPNNQYKPGQTEFVTVEPDNGYGFGHGGPAQAAGGDANADQHVPDHDADPELPDGLEPRPVDEHVGDDEPERGHDRGAV